MIPEGSFNLLNLQYKCFATCQQSHPKYVIIIHTWYGRRGQYQKLHWGWRPADQALGVVRALLFVV